MRNALAIIVGMFTSFIVFVITVYIFAYFDIGVSKDFLTANFNYYRLQSIIKYIVFIVMPITGFMSGFFCSLIAKNSDFVMGFICVLPIVIISHNMTIFYLIATIVVIIISMTIGVLAAKQLKMNALK